MKKSDHVGEDHSAEHDELYSAWKIDQVFKEDPSGSRIGYAPNNPNVVETIQRVAQDLDDYVDKKQVLKTNSLVEKILDDKIANIKGAVTIAYPMGLPDWDVLRLAFGSFDDLKVCSFFFIDNVDRFSIIIFYNSFLYATCYTK